jgi:hypothetical protein
MYQDSMHHTVYHSLNRAYGTQVTDTSYYTNTVTGSSLCQCPTCTNQVHVTSLYHGDPAPVPLPLLEYKPQYDWRELRPHPRCNIVRNEGRGRHPPVLTRSTLSPRRSARRKSWRTIRRAKPTPSKKDYKNHGDAGSETQYK